MDVDNSVQVLTNASDESQVATDLRETFLGLFPSVPMMIATILAFFLAFLLLVYLLYKPIKKYVAARQSYIQENINAAEQAKKQAQVAYQEASNTLTEARANAQDIISRAKVEAEKIAYKYIDQAKVDANVLINDAQLDIKRQQNEFEAGARNQVVESAVALAKKILNRELDPALEAKLIKDANLDVETN